MRRRRHRRDVAGEQDVGAGAVGAGAARRDPGDDRHAGGKYGLHDFAHRLHEPARRVHANDDELGVLGLCILDAVDDIFRGGDAQCTLDIE